MREIEKMDSSSFPNVPDDAIVDLDDRKVILEAPIKCGTKRQNSLLRFAYNFSNFIIKQTVALFPPSCPMCFRAGNNETLSLILISHATVFCLLLLCV